MTIRPRLSIKLNVTCPKCEYYIDMIEDTDLNEEGWLLDQVLPAGNWSTEHEKFKCRVTCPECSSDFNVEGVEW